MNNSKGTSVNNANSSQQAPKNKQKLCNKKRQTAQRFAAQAIAADELAIPTSPLAAIFWNATIFKRRQAHNAHAKTQGLARKQSDKQPNRKPQRAAHKRRLPKGKRATNKALNSGAIQRKTSNGIFATATFGANDFETARKLAEKVTAKSAARTRQNALAKIAALFLDKLRGVQLQHGGKVEITRAELVACGAIRPTTNANRLFEIVKAEWQGVKLTFNDSQNAVDFKNVPLFAGIAVERGKIVFDVTKGQVFDYFKGKTFFTIKRAALAELNARQFYGLVYLAGVANAKNARSADFCEFLETAGYSLDAVEHRHAKRLLERVNKDLQTIQQFLSFNVECAKGVQTFKEFFKNGRFAFVDKQAVEKAANTIADVLTQAECTDAPQAECTDEPKLKRFKTIDHAAPQVLTPKQRIKRDRAAIKRALILLDRGKYAPPKVPLRQATAAHERQFDHGILERIFNVQQAPQTQIFRKCVQIAKAGKMLVLTPLFAQYAADGAHPPDPPPLWHVVFAGREALC